MRATMTTTVPMPPIGGTQTKTLPSPPIEAGSIDATISLNKLAMITRRKCGRRGDESTTTDNKIKQAATVIEGATAMQRCCQQWMALR